LQEAGPFSNRRFGLDGCSTALPAGKSVTQFAAMANARACAKFRPLSRLTPEQASRGATEAEKPFVQGFEVL
jgi:hypothetical protein